MYFQVSFIQQAKFNLNLIRSVPHCTARYCQYIQEHWQNTMNPYSLGPLKNTYPKPMLASSSLPQGLPGPPGEKGENGDVGPMVRDSSSCHSSGLVSDFTHV